MVFTVPVREEPKIQQRYQRRAVLRLLAAVGAGATGVAGCGVFDREPPPPPPPDPLEPLRAQALELAERYDAALEALPDLAPRLTPLRDAHRIHAAELTRVIGRPVPSAGPSTGPSVSPSVAPADPAASVAALRTAEQSAAADAVAACLAAPGNRAGVVGAITAARTTHLEVLA